MAEISPDNSGELLKEAGSAGALEHPEIRATIFRILAPDMEDIGARTILEGHSDDVLRQIANALSNAANRGGFLGGKKRQERMRYLACVARDICSVRERAANMPVLNERSEDERVAWERDMKKAVNILLGSNSWQEALHRLPDILQLHIYNYLNETYEDTLPEDSRLEEMRMYLEEKFDTPLYKEEEEKQ